MNFACAPVAFNAKELNPNFDLSSVVQLSLKGNKNEDILKSYQLSEQLGELAITKNDVVFSVEWISTKTIDEIISNGITVYDLQELMHEMQNYCFTAEYEWIKSCYDRMISDL